MTDETTYEGTLCGVTRDGDGEILNLSFLYFDGCKNRIATYVVEGNRFDNEVLYILLNSLATEEPRYLIDVNNETDIVNIDLMVVDMEPKKVTITNDDLRQLRLVRKVIKENIYDDGTCKSIIDGLIDKILEEDEE